MTCRGIGVAHRWNAEQVIPLVFDFRVIPVMSDSDAAQGQEMQEWQGFKAGMLYAHYTQIKHTSS